MRFWLTAAVAAAITSGSAAASDNLIPQADKAVIQTMQQLFKTFEAGNQAELARLTTTDFRIFERGQYLSLDQVLTGLQALRKQNVVYEWNVTVPQLQVHGTVATIAYINQGSITKAGVRTPTTWYESGTLLFEHDRWRVMLVQSEKVRPEAVTR